MKSILFFTLFISLTIPTFSLQIDDRLTENVNPDPDPDPRKKWIQPSFGGARGSISKELAIQGLDLVETSGWRFRRINLNGSVAVASKGQAKAETDEQAEESYIDSLTRQLRHDTSDIYIPLVGSQTALSVKRSIQGEIFNNHSEKRPANSLNPFGPCWSTGVGAHIKFSSTDEKIEAALKNGGNSGSPITSKELGNTIAMRYVHVMDENGATYTFSQLHTFIDQDEEGEAIVSYLPLPSNQTNLDVLLCRLIATDTHYIFTRKFGSKLYFKKEAARTVSRAVNFKKTVTSTDVYHQLEKVVDRLDNTLVYSYLGESDIIPNKIEAKSGSGTARSIIIEHAQDRINKITDPRGNKWLYLYEEKSLKDEKADFLVEVQRPDGSSVKYDYEILTGLKSLEPKVLGSSKTGNSNISSPDKVSDPDLAYTHLNLNKITSNISNSGQISLPFGKSIPWENDKHSTISIEYQADKTVLAWHSATNNYYSPFNSRPRVVHKTHLPENVSATIESMMATYNGGPNPPTGGPLYLKPKLTINENGETTVESEMEGEREIKITDSEGHIRLIKYSAPIFFDNNQIEENLSGSTRNTNVTRKALTYVNAWQVCELTHPAFPVLNEAGELENKSVVERALFDVTAGLADKEIRDYSGNITRYEHTDQYKVTFNSPLLKQLENHPIFSLKYKEPTKEIQAVGTPEEITKSYKYYSSGEVEKDKHLTPASRIMCEMVDALGRVTKYGVDEATGLRKSESIYANQADADAGQNAVKESFFTYSNPTFPGFLTTTTVKSANYNNGSFKDFVKTCQPDQYGNNQSCSVDPSGLNITTSSTFDMNGNTLSSTDANGNVTSFTYDELNRIKSTTLADTGDGVATSYRFYTPRGKVLASQDALGNLAFSYFDGLNRTVKSQRILGDPSTAVYGVENAADIISTISYNKLNSPIRSVDPRGLVSTTEYDALQRVVKVTVDPDGLNLVSTMEYGENSGGTAFNTIDFKPTRAVDPRGYETIVKYDNRYRPIESKTQYQLSPALYVKSETKYDAVNNVVESLAYRTEDSTAKVVKSVFDSLNRPVSVTDAFGTSLAKTTTTTYSSTTAYKATDALGRCTETDFDAVGRAVAVWSPDPVTGLVVRGEATEASGSPVTRTEYDANSNVITSVNPLGRRFASEYDARNRKIKDIQPIVADATNPNAPANAPPTVHTEYDQVNNVTRVTDARGVISENTYDRAYRVITTTAAKGTTIELSSSSTYDKNSNILTATDGNGNTTKNSYDAINRLITTSTNPITGAPNGGASDITVTNSYDKGSNLVLVTDGKAQKTAFSYDGLNRNTGKTWDPNTPVARVETIEYDALLLLKTVDAKGQQITTTYDALFRPVLLQHPGRVEDDRAMNYDLIDNLLSVTYPNETVSNKTIRGCSQTYDKLNRMLTETSNGVTHSTTYDKAGNTLTQTYGQTNRVLTCNYDVLNRLLSCSEAKGTETARVTTYAYDLNSNITRKTLPNGTYTDKVYDELNRSKSITNLRADTTEIQKSTMTFDTIGNVLTIVESSASKEVANGTMTTTNEYDKVYRLAKETRVDTGKTATETKATSYTYSKANNRLTKSVVTNGATPELWSFSFGDATNGFNSNQLISYNRPETGETVSFTYDLNGNRAGKTVASADGFSIKSDTHSYDYNNRLVSLDYHTDKNSDKNGLYKYQYDHRTRRVSRDESTANSTNTRVVFSGGLSVQEHDEVSGAWNLATPSVEYIRGSDYGGGVGGVLYTIRNGNPSFNYYNSRGDVLAKTDDSGTTTWQANYEAFGTRTAENGETDDRQKANTKDEDPTGLLNEHYRYRDLEAGVFITRDPLGFVDGPNVYTYVRQNPWSSFDPLGLSLWDDWSNFVNDSADDVSDFSKGFAEGVEETATAAATGAKDSFVESVETFTQTGMALMGDANQQAYGESQLIAKADGMEASAKSAVETTTLLGEHLAANPEEFGNMANEFGEEVDRLSKNPKDLGKLTGSSLTKSTMIVATRKLAGGGKIPAKKVDAPNRTGYSNLSDKDFLTEVAGRAERKIGGTGAVAGTRKHSYAENVINRYQRMTGQRQNLVTEQSYLNGDLVRRGTAGSARPDVYDPTSGAIFDFKFTIRPGRGIPTRQQNKNLRNVPHVTSQTEINP